MHQKCESFLTRSCMSASAAAKTVFAVASVLGTDNGWRALFELVDSGSADVGGSG
jgi:hypothetical protein